MPDRAVAGRRPVGLAVRGGQQEGGEAGRRSTGAALLPQGQVLLMRVPRRPRRPRCPGRAWGTRGTAGTAVVAAGGGNNRKMQVTGQSLPVRKAVSLSCLHCSACVCSINSQETLTHALGRATACPPFSRVFLVCLSVTPGRLFPRLPWPEILTADSFSQPLQSIQEA